MKLLLTILSLLSIVNTLFGQNSKTESFIIPYEQNCSYGLIDQNGKIITSAKYKTLSLFYNTLDDTLYIATNFGNKKGIISPGGKIIIPLIFDTISLNLVSEGYGLNDDFVIVCRRNAKNFCFTTKGTLFTTKGEWKQNIFFCGNKDSDLHSDAVFVKDGKFGLINKEQIVAEPTYDTIISVDFGTDWFIAERDSKRGILDINGDTLYKFGNFDFEYNRNLFGFIIIDRVTRKTGFFAHTSYGKCNIPCHYDEIVEFLFGRFVLVKEKFTCPYYLDFITKQKYNY